MSTERWHDSSERIPLLSLSLSAVSVSYSRSTFTCWQIVTHEFIIERISVVTKATISSQCADIRSPDGDGSNLLIQCNGYGYIVNDNAMAVVMQSSGRISGQT